MTRRASATLGGSRGGMTVSSISITVPPFVDWGSPAIPEGAVAQLAIGLERVRRLYLARFNCLDRPEDANWLLKSHP
jgi:hypothetical protein